MNALQLKFIETMELIRDLVLRQAIGMDKLLIELIFHARPHPICLIYIHSIAFVRFAFDTLQLMSD